MAKPKKHTQTEFIMLFNRYIDEAILENFSEINCNVKDIQISKIAVNFEVNVATLRRWCMEYTQLSPKKYLDQYRINKAKLLLSQGIRSGEVATTLGFTEHKTFCSVFNRCT